ncbi:MAG: UDP-N-acetylmuramoyl-L-alanine--D-glutamate ligase [Legionellales bacterium]|nr:UDP-N-acetylmuramoyl-L-alanine--D-glutamate ligase [Legionellales bacterium]
MNANNYVVLGLGKTGLSICRFLTKNHLDFVVMDTRENPPGLAEFQQQFPNCPIYLNGLNVEILMQAQQIIISPGLSPNLPELMACHAVGIPIIGDIELFLQITTTPVVAITGTNAKSTVTTLVGKMAEQAGIRVKTGGNLGVPVLDLYEENTELYVLEVSSFQLDSTFSLQALAATILNISPDHLDRYASFEEYVASKQRIYQQARHVVFNRDDSNTWITNPNAEVWSFGESTPQNSTEFGLRTLQDTLYLARGNENLIAVSELPLAGLHNWMNYLAALALGSAIQLPVAAMLKTLREFPGLPHRCQRVAEIDDVVWYNDSKGTNIGATQSALSGLGHIYRKIILIMGGQGKGVDFRDINPTVCRYVTQLILIGEDAQLISAAIDDKIPRHFARSLDEAVNIAAEIAPPHSAVLLSPACASFDMFRNYEHRGEVFCQLVKQLIR